MADIDLKTLTPDTSLPTTGFLFGADSQASASPSVYSTQTVATTLLGSTSLTGATVTTSQPVLDLAQTWNASGVTFTGLRFNAATGSSANSAAGSLLMDLQLEGSSKFKVSKGGAVTTESLSANVDLYWTRDLYGVATNSKILFAGDTILTRRAAANLRLGAADAAGSAIAISSVASNQLTLASAHGLSNGAAVQITFTAGGAVPAGTAVNTTYYARSISAAVLELYGTYDQALNTASTTGRVAVTTAGTTAFVNRATPFQTLSVQSFTGTDIPGQPFVITGSRGTGTGRGGDIIFQVAPAGSSGTAQNALATALTISPGASSGPTATFSRAFITSYGQSTGTGQQGMCSLGVDGSSGFLTIGSPSNIITVSVASTGRLGFSSGSNNNWSDIDVSLFRDAANTLALRNANNGQTFRVYGRYTSATDHERFFISAPTTSGNTVLVGTDKGSGGGAARALALQTDGTTRLTIETNGDLTIADAENIILGTTTGTKIGTATTQKIGFYNAAPVVQPTAVADATDNATAITQLNALLAHMRTLGLIAT